MPRELILLKPTHESQKEPGFRREVVVEKPVQIKLDRCPLCNGKSFIEETGNGLYPMFNVVCRKCGCSSGTYRSMTWAAKRWNSRVSPTPSSKTVDEENVCEDDNSQDNAATDDESDAVEEDKRVAKRAPRVKNTVKKDLPGQMKFDFMEEK